jgi:hypothetical protein
MLTPNPMPPEREEELFRAGIAHFNAGEYFEAHEVWEELWHAASGVRHDFYQGLIQAAVALEHYRRSNPRGVMALHRSYPGKFKGVPERFMGLDVRRFLREMEEFLRPVVMAGPAGPGQIRLDVAAAPKIVLEGPGPGEARLAPTW